MSGEAHSQFMAIALESAKAALRVAEFPVGCVIVHDGRVMATGGRTGTVADRGRASEVDHAEMIALKRLESIDAASGFDPGEAVIYSTMEPCLMCFAAIMLSGIQRIVYAYEDVMGGGTRCDLTKLPPLYRNRSISVVPHILREESLDLFARFFSNKENRYWKGSLLESYTLNEALKSGRGMSK